eukprot:GHVT01100643.1.p1 GENE.GHVT01100643.1~~GHVT01100643.1.p1  ORF type:complete len:769 (+),score=192.40 GHVT01100643.1:1022-3328(+)
MSANAAALNWGATSPDGAPPARSAGGVPGIDAAVGSAARDGHRPCTDSGGFAAAASAHQAQSNGQGGATGNDSADRHGAIQGSCGGGPEPASSGSDGVGEGTPPACVPGATNWQFRCVRCGLDVELVDDLDEEAAAALEAALQREPGASSAPLAAGACERFSPWSWSSGVSSSSSFSLLQGPSERADAARSAARTAESFILVAPGGGGPGERGAGGDDARSRPPGSCTELPPLLQQRLRCLDRLVAVLDDAERAEAAHRREGRRPRGAVGLADSAAQAGGGATSEEDLAVADGWDDSGVYKKDEQKWRLRPRQPMCVDCLSCVLQEVQSEEAEEAEQLELYAAAHQALGDARWRLPNASPRRQGRRRKKRACRITRKTRNIDRPPRGEVLSVMGHAAPQAVGNKGAGMRRLHPNSPSEFRKAPVGVGSGGHDAPAPVAEEDLRGYEADPPNVLRWDRDRLPTDKPQEPSKAVSVPDSKAVVSAATSEAAELQLRQRLEEEQRECQSLEEQRQNLLLEFVELQDELVQQEEEAAACAAALKYASQQLHFLQRLNVTNDVFHIWQDGPFGTINGFRMGRLPEVPVSWDEINSGWGMLALLYDVLATKCNFRSPSCRLIPRGSSSLLVRISDGARLELYGTDGGFSRFFAGRRFDQAMVAFMQCTQELLEWLEQCRQKRLAQFASGGGRGGPHSGNGRAGGRRLSGGMRPIRLPFELQGERTEGISIRLQGNQDAQWTKALKFFLIDYKWLILHVEENFPSGRSSCDIQLS